MIYFDVNMSSMSSKHVNCLFVVFCMINVCISVSLRGFSGQRSLQDNFLDKGRGFQTDIHILIMKSV